MAKNERNTENLVRDALRELDYYQLSNNIRVEEQKSTIESIKKLLKGGSKSKGGGIGSPEFIISNSEIPDFLVIFECKASNADHESRLIFGTEPTEFETAEDEVIKRLKRYAADGVLHYASLLAKEFNVIAVAVSGETSKELKISTYLHTKGATKPKVLLSKASEEAIDDILPWHDYIDHAIFDPAVRQARLDDLMGFARELHAFMRDHAKLTESEKPLLVSGTLIALRNPAFSASYSLQKVGALPGEWIKVIRDEINLAEIPQAKKENMAQPYASIAVHPELGKETKGYPKGVLHELIKLIHEKAAPFIAANDGLDILGQFYGEFLKYTGGDKKALGIVLTPRHITELFALLANVHKGSTVVDICAGTGGFLISAMSLMMRGAYTEQQRFRIKKEGLIGVEQQPNMFALAASNMILRGDGKANLFQGSCFDEAIARAVRDKQPDVGLLNPPFSQGDVDLHELRFIQQMLSSLSPGGTGVAIVPMSCAISPHPIREQLLAEHTLEAVMSMPTELFYPVGVVSCIMVFTAHMPHARCGKKTWFGYWKDDGFVKTKHRGRVDLYGTWPEIRDHWIESFKNREVHAGTSVTQHVTANDEWCAEAYMTTDYSQLTQEDFEQELKKYVVFHILNEGNPSEASNDEAE
ncbi:class I SAM-dependent DNA methyltransferase [Pseudomonas sp. W2-17]|uniref:HsdM family class I SAM-dependent methyltransferase n=1 Tax=Pseudomonas sp. W2-17 TaxID=3058039 RepID=UPI0034E0BAAF